MEVIDVDAEVIVEVVDVDNEPPAKEVKPEPEIRQHCPEERLKLLEYWDSCRSSGMRCAAADKACATKFGVGLATVYRWKATRQELKAAKAASRKRLRGWTRMLLCSTGRSCGNISRASVPSSFVTNSRPIRKEDLTAMQIWMSDNFKDARSGWSQTKRDSVIARLASNGYTSPCDMGALLKIKIEELDWLGSTSAARILLEAVKKDQGIMKYWK